MDATLSQLESKLASALRGLDSAQTQLRITDDPSRWSIQQIVHHLLMTYASTAAAFEGRLAKGTPTRSRPTPRHRAAQFLVITLGVLPGGRKAPPEVTPPIQEPPLSGDELTGSLSDALGHLDTIIQQAESAFGTAPCMTHFVLGPLGGPQWRRFHLTHGRHHIRQILAIRRARKV